MQRKKNIRLLVSLAVLLAALAVILFSGSGARQVVDKALFLVPEQEKVDRVVLQSAKGKTELQFDGTRWLVDQQWEADRQLIKIFFATTLRAEPKRKTPAATTEKVMADLKSKGIKVSFFVSGTLTKEFWVVGNEQRTETYFAFANESPYLVTIPGYRAYVASVFEMSSNDWRDKRVFNFNGQNFKSLEANFPANPKEDFKIVFTGKSFEVEGVTALDMAKLNSYLDAVSFLQADRIMKSEKATLDSLDQLTPFQKIVVKDIGGNEYPLVIYPFERQSSTINGKAFKGEWVQFNLSTIAPVSVGKTYFQQKR
jgi:hypothetical protein